MPVIISLDRLFDHVAEKNEAEGHYLKNIQTTMAGYGPKHSKIMEMIPDEAFDFEPYLFSFVESKDQEFLQTHLEWCELLKSPANQEFIQQKAARLEELVNSDYVSNQIRFIHFQDEVDKALHTLTLKHYPSLFDLSDKHLKAYRHTMVQTTQHFAAQIESILQGRLVCGNGQHGSKDGQD